MSRAFLRAPRVRTPIVAGLLGASLLLPTVAHAQKPANAPQGSDWKKGADKTSEAREKYSLGMKLYDDGNFEAARIEFERAYAVSPSYRILYNIALAYKQLNNYVDALRAFERYLLEGASEVPAERGKEVEAVINELRARIGRLEVKSNVAGTEIAVDDVPAGKTPFAAPILVNPGVRKISAQAPGHFPATKSATVGSGESTPLDFQLASLPKQDVRVVENRGNPWTTPTIVGWTVTGAAVIATGIFGFLALDARNEQENLNAQLNSSEGARNDARSKTQTLSTTTDILGITSLALAGTSLFFTLKMISSKPHSEGGVTTARSGNVDVRIAPHGIAAVGTF